MNAKVLPSLIVAAVLSIPPVVAFGQDLPAAAPQQEQAQIPVKQVVLFSSGVGYFEHFGNVTGQKQAELRFKTEQINDILKSLVLQDLDGGTVSTITYPSQDPLAKQLKSFQVDIASNPSLADLLNQLRGAQVSVTHLAEKVSGTILGVEKKKLPTGKDGEQVLETSVLNLLMEGGKLVAIKLDDVSGIDLADPQLQAELSRALLAVAQARDQDKKPVLINFTGQGERRVRLGYVVETPIWKTSYRLIVPPDGGQAKPRLQGWAIVENQTDNDWDNVQLSLVSGRPISFVMNLYQPLYVPRPVVEPELFASLRPQAYAAGVDRKEEQAAGQAVGRRVRGGGGGMGGADGLARQQLAEAVSESDSAALGLAMAPAAAAPMDPTASIASVASASEIGELFQYTVGNVSLPRQKSAMIPIITDDIEVEKLSIYNQSVLARHPLNGARIKNTTGKHLLQGPITVFEDNSYAGDAQVNNVPPGQERLVSYGVDLNMVVNSQPKPQETSLVAAKIVKGVLELTHKYVANQLYTLENKSDADRTVIIEHPVAPDWKLLEPEKPLETTDRLYRFRTSVAAGKTSDFAVKQEKVEAQGLALLPMDVTMIAEFVRNGQIDDKVRDALRKAGELKQKVVDSERQIAEHQQQLEQITQEQNRIRENLRTVPQNSQYYTRLMTKLNDQESKIETLQTEKDKLQDQFNAQRGELEAYLNDLSIG
jgi:hypothetical protein